MKDTVVFILDYLGGVSIAYIAAVSIVGTQAIKVAAKASGFDRAAVFRLVNYLLGTLAGLEFIGGMKGALIGLAVSGVAAACYFALRKWLSSSEEPWRQSVAKYMSGES